MQDDDAPLLNARRQSERVLGIGDGLDQVRLLRHVDEQDYVVPEEQIDAMQVLVNPAGRFLRAETLARADRRDCEVCLDLKVAAFRQFFFSLCCDERQRRWESLLDECRSYPHLTTRLMRLKAGLAVATPTLPENPGCRSLLQTCFDVFVAPPREGAELRLSFCQDWRNHPSFWEDIVDAMTEHNRDFFESIAPWVDAFGEQRFNEALHDRESYLAQFAGGSAAGDPAQTDHDIGIQRQLLELQRTHIPPPAPRVRREFMSILLIAITCVAVIGTIAIHIGDAIYLILHQLPP